MLTTTYNLLRRTLTVCFAVATAAFATAAAAQSFTCSFPTISPNGAFSIACSPPANTGTTGTTGTGGTTTGTAGGVFTLAGSTTMSVGTSGTVSVTRSGAATGGYNVSIVPSPANVCSGGGTITFNDGASAATNGNVVGITPVAAGTCTVTLGLSAPSGTQPTNAATTAGSPLVITISSGPTQTVQNVGNCPALPSNYIDISPYPTTSGPATTVRMASGVTGGFPLPMTNAGHSSGAMWIVDNTIGPNSSNTIEIGISRCKGQIDPNAGACYLKTQPYNSITWAGKNPQSYSSTDLNNAGFCPAFESQGTWYMNVRYNYASCLYGTCGETFTWYDSYY